MNYQKFNDNLSLILQMLSFELLLKDCTNNAIMEELQTQDERYLKTIIKQNNQIIALLRKENDDAREVTKEK